MWRIPLYSLSIHADSLCVREKHSYGINLNVTNLITKYSWYMKTGEHGIQRKCTSEYYVFVKEAKSGV